MPNLSSIITPNGVVTVDNELTLNNKTLADPIIQFSNGGSKFTVPTGTTAERPTNASVGDLRFNTDEGGLEQYNGTNWIGIASGDLDGITISVGGTEVINADRELKNITNADNIIQQPTNQSPNDGVTNIGATAFSLTLETSSYNDLYGGQGSVRFQVSDTSDFSNVVIDQTVNSTTDNSYTINDVRDNLTDGQITYYWRAQYEDVNGKVSLFSEASTFVTASTFPFVDAPTITSPSDNATDISESPTITTSSFSTTGVTDTHSSTDWQIATDSSFSNIVYESLNDSSNLTSITVPLDTLSESTVYYVRARHTGANLDDSSYSGTISFTTTNVFFVPRITIAGSDGRFGFQAQEQFYAVVQDNTTDDLFIASRIFSQPAIIKYDKQLNYLSLGYYDYTLDTNNQPNERGRFLDLTRLSNGNFVANGLYDANPQSSIFVIFDNNLNIIAEKEIYDSSSYTNFAQSNGKFLQTSDGNLHIKGNLNSTTKEYFITLDQSDLSIVNEVNTGLRSFGPNVLLDNGNMIFVSSFRSSTSNNYVIEVLLLDQNLSIIDSKRIEDTRTDYNIVAKAITQKANGNIVIATQNYDADRLVVFLELTETLSLVTKRVMNNFSIDTNIDCTEIISNNNNEIIATLEYQQQANVVRYDDSYNLLDSFAVTTTDFNPDDPVDANAVTRLNDGNNIFTGKRDNNQLSGERDEGWAVTTRDDFSLIKDPSPIPNTEGYIIRQANENYTLGFVNFGDISISNGSLSMTSSSDVSSRYGDFTRKPFINNDTPDRLITEEI